VVVIPALNAQATIGPVVAAARRHVPRTIVVDDGSVDATGEAARRAGAEVIRHPSNLGKGAALTTAFEALRSERGAALQADSTIRTTSPRSSSCIAASAPRSSSDRARAISPRCGGRAGP
jgi:glycosyltransferase involved in cell wall biosynthesis